MKIHDVNPNYLINKAAKELESKISMPEWALFIKTGHGKDRPPVQRNWYHLRAAAILRKIYMEGPIGVAKLRTHYGNKKNKGSNPEKFALAGGKIIRSILQQLEKAQLIKQDQRGNHKGRVITPQGKSFLDKLAK